MRLSSSLSCSSKGRRVPGGALLLGVISKTGSVCVWRVNELMCVHLLGLSQRECYRRLVYVRGLFVAPLGS